MAEKKQKRPFDQSTYDRNQLQLKTLRGYALKFTLILPILWKGKRVFSESDEWKLQSLLTGDFGGCTYSYGVTHPLFQGTYVNEKGNIIRNENAVYTVYANHTDQSKDYFKELQHHLQKYSGEEKILIEMIAVTLL